MSWFIESVIDGQWVRQPHPVTAEQAFAELRQWPESTVLVYVCGGASGSADTTIRKTLADAESGRFVALHPELQRAAVQAAIRLAHRVLVRRLR